jgi:hypothetical protein
MRFIPFDNAKRELFMKWVGATKKVRRTKMDKMRLSSGSDPQNFRKSLAIWRKYTAEAAATRVDNNELRWVAHTHELGRLPSEDRVKSIEENKRFRTRLVNKFRHNTAYRDGPGVFLIGIHRYAVLIAQRKGEIDTMVEIDSEGEPLVKPGQASSSDLHGPSVEVKLEGRIKSEAKEEESEGADVEDADERPFEQVTRKRMRKKVLKPRKVSLPITQANLIQRIQDATLARALKASQKVDRLIAEEAQAKAKAKQAARKREASTLGSVVDEAETGEESEYDLTRLVARSAKGRARK